MIEGRRNKETSEAIKSQFYYCGSSLLNLEGGKSPRAKIVSFQGEVLFQIVLPVREIVIYFVFIFFSVFLIALILSFIFIAFIHYSISTNLWILCIVFSMETAGEEARRELHKNAASNLE